VKSQQNAGKEYIGVVKLHSAPESIAKVRATLLLSSLSHLGVFRKTRLKKYMFKKKKQG